MKKLLAGAGLLLAALGLMAWGGLRLTRLAASTAGPAQPTTRVKRSDVVITVTSRGELQGGNSEMMAAPMTGGNDMAITSLRSPGELVKQGDVVVQFDTTEQEFNLREAEADLAEAEQKVSQAQADTQAREEETRYALLQAQADVHLAELDVRRNPIMAAIIAQENNLALEAAHDKLRQMQRDLANRQNTSTAAIAIEEAARNKAKVKAETARKNIENMTLRARSGGYVNVQQNNNADFAYWGMQLPMLQVGDTVRAGMAVAQIPDLKNWEVVARIGELDRGHLAAGQKADISVIALPGRPLTGIIKDLGGTTGPPWDRHFDCHITVRNPTPEMRPGMTARVVITTGVLEKVLWLPSQALFESDGRTFVYIRSGGGFVPHDVKLVRRSESQVVLDGVSENQLVALSSPDQQTGKSLGAGSAMKALSK